MVKGDQEEGPSSSVTEGLSRTERRDLLNLFDYLFHTWTTPYTHARTHTPSLQVLSRIHHTSKYLVSLKKSRKGPGQCEPERTEQPQGWDVGEPEVSRRRKVEPQMAIKVLGVCKDLWEGVRLPTGCVMRA